MDYRSLLTWAFIFAFLALIIAFYFKDRKRKEGKTSEIAFDAILIAIILTMGLIPQLGYLFVFPWLALTLLHVPVLIGASLGGPRRGLLYGFAFGFTSMIQAFVNASGLNAFFVYPWVSILPRLLFGFLAGLAFSLARRSPKLSSGLGNGLLSFFLTLLHTGLVFLALFLFFPVETGAYFRMEGDVAVGVGITFAASLLLGALGEALIAGIIVPAVRRPLLKLSLRNNRQERK